MRGRRTLGLAIAVALAGCAAPGVDRVDTGPGAAAPAGTARPDREPGVVLLADVDRAEPDGAEVDALVAGITAFGSDLINQVAEPGTNVVLSPSSIATAFGMARAGAEGETADQIDATFSFPVDPTTTHASFNALTRALEDAAPTALTEPDPEAERDADEGEAPEAPALAVANALFPALDLSIHDAYLEVLAAQYGVGVIPVDFGGDAAEVIDAWVTEQTRGRIDRLFDQLPADTRMVLANAVYLKAEWLMPFSNATTDEPFTLADGTSVDVPMMRQDPAYVRHAVGEGWQAVELPYVGERLAMRVLVPTDAATTPVSLLSPAVQGEVGASLADAVVNLSMPRFDFATDLPLVEPLLAMGLTVPFSGAADFSGISDENMFIGQAVHRANITVDEWGTEAAAVTGLSFPTSAPPPPDITMAVDRPFAFTIVEQTTGLPLFTGIVSDPLTT